MANRKAGTPVLLAVLITVAATSASAQSFRVQCPATTITHPSTLNNNNAEPAYTAATTLAPGAATPCRAVAARRNPAA